MKIACPALGIMLLFCSLALGDGFTIEPFVTNAGVDSMDVCFQSDQDLSASIDFGLTDSYGGQVPVDSVSFDAQWGDVYPLFDDPTYSMVARYAYCGRIEGLAPDTLYHYSVELGLARSVDRTFVTAPQEGTSFSFVAYGDSRSDPLYPMGVPNRFHERVVEEMDNRLFDLLFNVGDIVNDGYDIRLWEIAMGEIAPVSAEYVYYPIFGNHERRNEGGISGADVYSLLFSNPAERSGSNSELYYSFDYANAHFTVLDTNVDFDSSTEQGLWLISDLEAASADETIRWKFLFFHHPPYSSSLVGIGDERSLVTREQIPPIAETYGVDVVFSGHQHSYERSFKDGVYYIVAGNGGALPSFAQAQALNPYSQYFDGNPNFQHFGFCLIDIQGDHLLLHSIISDGTVIDTLEIDKTVPDDDDDDNDDNDDNDDSTDDDDSAADDDDDDDNDDDNDDNAGGGNDEKDDDEGCCG